MSEIEITLPTVQYGNVKIRATPSELGIDSVADAAAIGVATAVYLNAFTQGFKRGALIDVDIDTSPAAAHSDPTDEAVNLVSSRLGATVVEESDVPWEGDVPAAPKAWERNAKPAKVAQIDW